MKNAHKPLFILKKHNNRISDVTINYLYTEWDPRYQVDFRGGKCYDK